MRHRVVDELPEVTPDSGLAAADIHVEDLHALELVDYRHALARGELARIAPAGARQAVNTREVARVRELPGQADRGVEARLELVDERHAHESSFGTIMPVPASVVSARS